MKKILNILAVSTLVLSMAACTAKPAAENTENTETAEPEVYTYEGIEAWDDELRPGKLRRDTIKSMGAPWLDEEQFIHSREGEDCFNGTNLLNYFENSPDSETHIRYWQEHNMNVEKRDWEDADRQWLLFTPISLTESNNKTYPVLFVWHGYMNTLMIAEVMGFNEIAAEKEWIVVMPWANNDETYLEEFDRIYETIESKLPIDKTRVYSTGFSMGGRVSALLSQERSDKIAAAAANGVNPSTHFYTGEELTERQIFAETTDLKTYTKEPEWFEDGVISEDEKNQAVPIQFYGGRYDVLGAALYNCEDKINGVNMWLQVFGLEPNQKLDTEANLIETGEMGLQFTDEEERVISGETVTIGSFGETDGTVRFRVIQGHGAIHTATQSMCQLTFEFLEQFAKDPETGKTVVR